MAHILLVEDSPTVISGIQALLAKNGHTVVIARDGLTALTALRAFRPEIVLLDIMLPHMSGIELCGYIRKQSDYDKVTVIMMTGLKETVARERSFEAGANDFLTKPVSEADLLKVIEERQKRTDEATSVPVERKVASSSVGIL